MLTKTICLVAAAAALMGCADVPSRGPGLFSNSPQMDTPRNTLLADTIAASRMGFAASAPIAMDQAYRDVGRQQGRAHSPAEIHAAFAASSGRRATVHPVPIARMLRQAQVTQARLEAESAAQALDNIADSSVARIQAKIYRVFASWPQRRDPIGSTKMLRVATTTTPAEICGSIDSQFVEVVYGAQLACETPKAPQASIEVTVAY
jgi:hypothetical protein